MNAPPPSPNPGNLALTRVTLRPVATPLPLGFLGLFFATTLVSGLQLHWVPASDGHLLAIAVLVLTVPVQLIASIYGFLARDLVAGTGMGLLAGSWAAVAVALLRSPPGSTSSGLGFLLVLAGVSLLVPAVAAAEAKVLAASVVLGTFARFEVTAAYEMSGSPALQTAAGAVGVALGALALYAALAFELEDAQRRTVLPTFRRGGGLVAMTGDLGAQVGRVENEAGVRQHL